MARGGGEHSPTFKAVGQRSQQEQEECLSPLCSSSPFNKVGITNYNKLYGRAVWSHRTLTSQDLLIQYIQYAHPIPTTWFWPIRGHQRPLWHEWQLQYVVHCHTWAIPAVIPSLHGLQRAKATLNRLHLSPMRAHCSLRSEVPVALSVRGITRGMRTGSAWWLRFSYRIASCP